MPTGGRGITSAREQWNGIGLVMGDIAKGRIGPIDATQKMRLLKGGATMQQVGSKTRVLMAQRRDRREAAYASLLHGCRFPGVDASLVLGVALGLLGIAASFTGKPFPRVAVTCYAVAGGLLLFSSSLAGACSSASAAWASVRSSSGVSRHRLDLAHREVEATSWADTCLAVRVASAGEPLQGDQLSS